MSRVSVIERSAADIARERALLDEVLPLGGVPEIGSGVALIDNAADAAMRELRGNWVEFVRSRELREMVLTDVDMVIDVLREYKETLSARLPAGG